MEFRIADTFTDSLARLTGDEQKAVKTTAFDLQLNPANPGMSFHKLDKAKDKNFWSVRVSSDIRLIVHKTPGSLLLCYVDHHDKPMTGRSGASWRRIPRRARRSWLRSARRSRRSLSRSTCRTRSSPKPTAAEKAAFRRHVRRRTAGLRRARRVAERRQAGHRRHAACPDRPSARRGRGGAAGTGDRRQAACPAARAGRRRIRSIIPMRSAGSA